MCEANPHSRHAAGQQSSFVIACRIWPRSKKLFFLPGIDKDPIYFLECIHILCQEIRIADKSGSDNEYPDMVAFENNCRHCIIAVFRRRR
jgi:hypothetical protein